MKMQIGSMYIGDLSAGSSGTDVQTLQHDLNVLGFVGADGNALTEDGQFGANTTFALKAFQGSAGITQDGIAGPNTMTALTNALANPMSVRAANPNAATGPGLLDGLSPTVEAIGAALLVAVIGGVIYYERKKGR